VTLKEVTFTLGIIPMYVGDEKYLFRFPIVVELVYIVFHSISANRSIMLLKADNIWYFSFTTFS
jgi:hypothetical protein